MFSSAKKVVRGYCSCCGAEKSENNKLYILDIRDVDMKTRNWEPKLIESDVDFSACLRCWGFVGHYLTSHVRITSYV